MEGAGAFFMFAALGRTDPKRFTLKCSSLLLAASAIFGIAAWVLSEPPSFTADFLLEVAAGLLFYVMIESWLASELKKRPKMKDVPSPLDWEPEQLAEAYRRMSWREPLEGLYDELEEVPMLPGFSPHDPEWEAGWREYLKEQEQIAPPESEPPKGS